MESGAKSKDKNILHYVKVSLDYLKYVVLAWVILFIGLLIFPALGFRIFLGVAGSATSGFESVLSSYWVAVAAWTWFVALLVVIAWPFVAFIVWAVKDSRKFKVRGINTRPYLWGMGMIFPLILVTFPLYFIYRSIIWPKKLGVDTPLTNLENTKIIKEKKGKRKWLQGGILVLLVLFVVLPLVFSLLIQVGIRNKAIGNFLINVSLANSCTSVKSGCDELRPIPKILQNKKIIFNEDTSIQFDPRYRPEISFTDLDILGSLDTNQRRSPQDTIVDPKLGERGYLSEREYRIIRAVYHYNCSYCIDSSDYAYIVLEDSKGNRFSSLLEYDYWNPSMETARTLQWDERVPYDLGGGSEFGKLVDITPTSTQ